MSIPIQVLSDIHLEQSNEGKCFLSLRNLSPYLFLVGDIGHIFSRSWRNFMEYCARTWKQVFVVLGNHEYYSEAHKESLPDLEERYEAWFAKFPNIHWVRPGTITTLIDHPYIFVIGGTGWSKPSEDTKKVINDFHHIYVREGELMCPESMSRLHDQEFGYILAQIEKHPKNQYIVATHFPPIYHGVTHPYHQDTSTSSYFRNDYTIRLPNIRAWLFGHTHYSSVLQKDGILFISNQFGRPSERHNTVFRKDALFYI